MKTCTTKWRISFTSEAYHSLRGSLSFLQAALRAGWAACLGCPSVFLDNNYSIYSNWFFSKMRCIDKLFNSKNSENFGFTNFLSSSKGNFFNIVTDSLISLFKVENNWSYLEHWWYTHEWSLEYKIQIEIPLLWILVLNVESNWFT